MPHLVNYRLCNFNPRSCEGATNPALTLPFYILRFQSTLLRRSDWCKTLAAATSLVFQSTLLRRSDVTTISGCRESCISIHAPAKERPGVQAPAPDAKRDFNPRSCEGATSGRKQGLCHYRISIHAPAKERPEVLVQGTDATTFQSTLLRRSDKL